MNSIEEIRKAINADSLHFLTKEGLLDSIGQGSAGKRADIVRLASITAIQRKSLM